MHAKKPAKGRAQDQQTYRRGYLAGAQRWCRYQALLKRVVAALRDASTA